MKTGVVVFLLAVLGVGCAANTEEQHAAQADVDAAAPYDDEEVETQVGVSSQALQIGGGSTGAKPWCAARKTCYDQCDKDYGKSAGPLATCKKLCDSSTASKCRAFGAVGVGEVIY